MQLPDIEIYQAWMAGASIGSLAKKYKVEKQQIRNILNKVAKGREWTERLTQTEQ
jgi:Mor family transcriptional regulator